MTMEKEQAIHRRRHRGLILQHLSNNHYNQSAPLDDIGIWSLLCDIAGGRLGQNYVVTLLQELKGAGYVTYVENTRKLTGETRLERVMITTNGRRLIEGYAEDPMVLIS